MDNSLLSDPRSKSQAEDFGIALLTITSAHDYGGVLGTQIPIYLGTDLWVGRDESKCSLFFRSNIVSGIHFHIYSVIYDEDCVVDFPPMIYCEDHSSTNGTYVNGILIGKMMSPRSPYLLSDGDVISIRPYWTFLFTQKSHGVERDMDNIQTQELKLIKDRYDVSCKLLGSGIYGRVFLARDMATQMQLACKIVDLRKDALVQKECTPAVHEDRKPKAQAYAETINRVIDVRKKLMREIEILSKLSHPNVVTLYKAFRSPHSLYIFSELAAGGDLFSFLQDNGYCLDDLHARVISRQVAIAVEYLHSQGVAHRDLKPENILVMRRGIGHRVVLTDFGCAGYSRSPTGRMMSTVGTFDYVAPEVYKTNMKGYTEAIDMWSLGVITLCLLTGDALITFDSMCKMSQSDIATLLANANDKHSKWRDLNVHGKDFVTKLLVLDPEKRMTSHSAIKHNWFKKPARVAVELDKLYERANVFWPKRPHDIGIIEDLPNLIRVEELVSPTHKNGVQQQSQIPRKIPDATASRYFGLERNLRSPGAPSKSMLHLNRKRVLEALEETDGLFTDTFSQSGSSSITLTKDAKLPFAHREKLLSIAQLKETKGSAFLSNGLQMSTSWKRTIGPEEVDIKIEELSNLPGANKFRRLISRPRGRLVVKEVSGNDLFGIPIETEAAQAAEAASDEMSPFDPFLEETFSDEHFGNENFLSHYEPSPEFRQTLPDGRLVGDAIQRPEMSISSSILKEEIDAEVRKRLKRPLLGSFSPSRDDLDIYEEATKTCLVSLRRRSSLEQVQGRNK